MGRHNCTTQANAEGKGIQSQVRQYAHCRHTRAPSEALEDTYTMPLQDQVAAKQRPQTQMLPLACHDVLQTLHEQSVMAMMACSAAQKQSTRHARGPWGGRGKLASVSPRSYSRTCCRNAAQEPKCGVEPCLSLWFLNVRQAPIPEVGRGWDSAHDHRALAQDHRP